MQTTQRTYHLTPAGRTSARARAARVANLAKARAHPYRQTEKRQAASRANLAKAIAARRTPAGSERARLNALKHGLYSRLVPESSGRLGENPAEFAAHRQRLELVFRPADEAEREIVRRLAETIWRRLRLWGAAARWEADRLRALVEEAPRASRLSAEETESRAYALVHLLNDFGPFFNEASRLEAQMERGLRQLLRKRSGGEINFKVLCPRRETQLDAADDEWTVEEVFKQARYEL